MMNVIADELANDLGCTQIPFNSTAHQLSFIFFRNSDGQCCHVTHVFHSFHYYVQKSAIRMINGVQKCAVLYTFCVANGGLLYLFRLLDWGLFFSSAVALNSTANEEQNQERKK